MGCGCRERKERLASWAERRGHERTAKFIRAIPSPGETPEPHPAERWSMHDLPMSGRTSLGGPPEPEEPKG